MLSAHNVQRYITKEGDVQIGVRKPYGISYLDIVPKRTECGNILVPVCLSASHVAYGSIRMEPVFIMLGQSSGVAAALAVKNRKPVQDVNYSKLKKILLDCGQILPADEY